MTKGDFLSRDYPKYKSVFFYRVLHRVYGSIYTQLSTVLYSSIPQVLHESYAKSILTIEVNRVKVNSEPATTIHTQL